jgi:nitrite reductase/ring-hydroxylating ferredoxin subunit
VPTRTVSLCLVDELADGDARGFDPLRVGHDTIFIVRQGRQVHAWRDECPHMQGVALPWRKDAYLNAARDRIMCSAHGALFDIATGLCTLGPCLGQFLTPVFALVDDSGRIHVQVEG